MERLAVDTATQNVSRSPESPGAGGVDQAAGEKPRGPRGASGLTEIHEQRLLKRSLRDGWGRTKRWNTDLTAADLAKLAEEKGGQLTLKERMLLSVMDGVASKDERVRGIAVRNGLTMESQNQADELKQIPDMHLNIHTMATDQKRARLDELVGDALTRRPAEA